MKHEVYDIEGMHCAACSGAVERVTKRLDGVESSSVNLPMKQLTISYDENLCSSDAIIQSIQKAGFSATAHIDEVRLEDDDDKELKAFKAKKRELIISCCLAFVLLSFSMTHMFVTIPLPSLAIALIELLLAIPVLILGRRFFISGVKSLLSGVPNMDTLVALSSTASFIYSLVITLLIPSNPELVHSLYFESSAVVIALISVGKFLEANSQKQTKQAIKALYELSPKTAILVDKNGEREVPIDIIKNGDTILVKAGSHVPLDAKLTSGTASIDEAMLTGESIPVDKKLGDPVIGGSICLDGAFYATVTAIGEDLTLTKIIRFVEAAQGKKAPIAKLADKVSGVFVPVVMTIAILAAAVWLLLGKSIEFALQIFTSVLVIACPCAMGLATPTAILVGTGIGASNGILIRSGEALEQACKIDTVIFDKTGTLTEGKPKVVDIVSNDTEELMRIALGLEKLSSHPLATAIVEYATSNSFTSELKLSDFKTVSGGGACALDENNNKLLIGSKAYLLDNSVDCSAYESSIMKLQDKGRTLVMVARNQEVIGILGISDILREDSLETVATLKTMGIKTVLMSGDNKKAATSIGNRLSVDETIAEVLPTQKAEHVKVYQEGNHKVLMVGDGINDAPALASADLGLAIGTGSDIAIDSADIVLMDSKLSGVTKALKLSRMTIRNIKQNLFWAFCYNTLAIPIACGVFYPLFGLLLSPMIGGIAMSLSSLFVVTNSLRLRRKKL